jgi:hypothetical protein
MALDINHPTKERRPVGLLVGGAVLLALAGGLIYNLWMQSAVPLATSQTYEYKVKQSTDHTIQYFQSSFYDNKPGVGDDAYVTKLTRQITPTFNYTYEASREAELTYYYSVKATVKATYSIPGDTETKTYSVWKKEFPLVKPQQVTSTTKSIVINREIAVPFGDYKKTMDDFRVALGLPTTSELEVAFTVQVTSTVDGAELNDVETAVIKTPLDQDIFKLSITGVRDDKKQIVTQKAMDDQGTFRMIEKVAAGLMFVAGAGMIVYGMRRQIFKTPYQRELDKIFKYHDGIIIRASKQAELAGKNVVPVKTFDDILNLEEELKAPIVASPAGSEATQFIIVHGDVVYLYTLGRVFVDKESFTGIEQSFEDEMKSLPPRRTVKRKAKRKIQ